MAKIVLAPSIAMAPVVKSLDRRVMPYLTGPGAGSIIVLVFPENEWLMASQKLTNCCVAAIALVSGVPKYASFHCAPCIWRFLLSHSLFLLSCESINGCIC